MKYRRENCGPQTHLYITGELDALSAPELRIAVDVLIEEKCKSIVVDLSDLDLIDSSGVGVIVRLFKRAKAHGGRVEVRGAKDQPLAVFKLLRMDRVFMQLGGASA